MQREVLSNSKIIKSHGLTVPSSLDGTGTKSKLLTGEGQNKLSHSRQTRESNALCRT